MTAPHGLPTSALLRLAEQEVDRLRCEAARLQGFVEFVEQIARLDDPAAEPSGVQAMSRHELADAAREVLR